MMTDGENAKGGIHDAGADRMMLDACANMRGDGIEIFAVALQTPVSARPLFVQCTGSEQKVFSPRNSSELRAAFAAVAQKALENRIIQMVE